MMAFVEKDISVHVQSAWDGTLSGRVLRRQPLVSE